MKRLWKEITHRERLVASKRIIFLTWLFYFLYALSVGVFVQAILLPYLFPQWHAGNGLLPEGDWLDFHTVGAQMAQKIRTLGWSAWELTPGSRTSLEAGIASAIYAVTFPSPLVLLPLQAALHASGALVLTGILLSFSGGRWFRAFYGTIPFLIMPSTLIWVAMIHKDGASILACLLFLLSWILFSRLITSKKFPTRSLLLGLVAFAGCWTLTWFVRAYLTAFLVLITYFFCLFIGSMALLYFGLKKLRFRNLIAALTVVSVLGFSTTQIKKYYPTFNRNYPTTAMKAQNRSFDQILESPSETLSALAQNPTELAEPGKNPPLWVETGILPMWMEEKMYAIANVRTGFLSQKLGTNIDENSYFRSAMDLVRYFPRAVVLMFFAPLPEHWVGKGAVPSNTAFRRVVGMEMLFVYLVFPFFLYSVYLHRRSIETWLCLIFCSGGSLMYVYSAPNGGALHRFRYGFLMVFVGMGVTTAVKLFSRWRGVKRVRLFGEPAPNEVIARP